LGNASPGEVYASNRIGALSLDLEGEWKTDANVTASCGIGECTVRLPDDVFVEIDDADIGIGELSMPGDRGAPPPGAPTLTLKASGHLGEVSIRR
jgi:hypothetical protein